MPPEKAILNNYFAVADAPDAFSDREEDAWLARARMGDEAAYRWLLERYRARVVRLAAHVLRREAEAEDVAQETFLRAFRGIGGFHGRGGQFAPWLFRIAVRLCLDRQRRASWREVGAEISTLSAVPGEDADTRLLVAALLDQLSPPMRAALVLREIEGLDYDEIAAALNIPTGTVRSRLHAARAQFRRLWEAAQEDTDNAH